MRWIDQYSRDGKRYRISTAALHASRTMAGVKSYAGVCVTRSAIQRSSARMLPVRHAASKPLDSSGAVSIAVDGFVYIRQRVK
jgi:hypothetical protein